MISENREECPSVVLEELTDEAIPILRIDGLAKAILIFALICCIVINTFGKVFLVYYIKERAPKRPLNDMILIDQVLINLQLKVITILS